MRIRVGVDTGGTFTDFAVIRDGKIEIFKELSTPSRPEEAILHGIGKLAGDALDIIHGSTVATNALLERKGARTALLTTAGFEDVLAIGRQTRRELYDIFVKRPPVLVPDELRLGVRERVLYDGTIEEPLDLQHLRAMVSVLQGQNVEAIAVSLLFSFANPAHEEAILRELIPLNAPVSLSSRVLPEYREYERTSTTVINAYLAPVMSRYLRRLQGSLPDSPIRVMQSNGGAVQAEAAAAAPVRAIVSGPAGGVVGAFHVAQESGYANIISFDMGGTSTDVSLCEGAIKLTYENEIDGMPIGISMIDIHTVGAGGGSIAEMDPGGALKVGPESAGSAPGPICYGTGERLTVTDANLILGRLRARFFLGGAMELAEDRVQRVAAGLDWIHRWESLEDLAQGVVDVVNSNMEHAIRLISVERGHDPHDFALFSFGGAGGLHAADLARALGIPEIVVPRFPGALSALGLLLADARKDYSRSLLANVEQSEQRIDDVLDELHRTGTQELIAEGFGEKEVRIRDFVDLRYRGQSYELTIPMSRNLIRHFHETHERRYGHSNPEKPVEVVNIRTSLTGRVPKPRFRKAPRANGKPQPVDVRPIWLHGKQRKARIYDRAMLGYGHVIEGPAIIGEYSSTTFVPGDFQCRIDAHLNLVLSR